jgi:iron complex outermembrane receptor protein
VVSGSSAWAQALAIAGRVVDAQGRAVAGAEVTVSGNGQAARTIRAAADGAFSVPVTAAGSYTVRVEASGFGTWMETVTPSASPLTVSLQVATVSEDVTVRGAIIGTAATGKTTLPERDLPMTIQGVSSEVLEEQGANDLVAALKNVPGVYSFTTYGVYEYYSFRGFLDSVQLVDGVRNEGNRVNTQLTNVERVEVLKGPSSALYGGAALGATVNLIRKKPSAMPEYDFKAVAGSWQTGRGAFGATGRLGNDSLLYRLDLGGETSDGYRHNDATRFTVTPSLSWRGGDNQVNVYYTFNRDRFAGDAGLPLVDPGFGVPTDQNVPDIPRDRNFRTPQDRALSLDNNLQVAYARQLSDAIGFRDTISYRHFDDEYFLSEEVDFIAPRTIDRYYLYFKHHRRPLMNIAELTARTTRGIEQNLVFGYEAQRYHNFSTLPAEDFFQAASIDAFDPVETQGPSDLTPARQNVFTNTTNAFYVQDNLTLAPKLRALLGGRYDIYRRNSHSDDLTGGAPVEGPVAHRQTEAFSGRAGLVYQPTAQVDVYGSFANSFKPLTDAQPDGSSLEPETGTQYEVGQRFRMFGERAELNTAVYRILRQNVPFRRPGSVFVQAGEVRSRGFEADLETSPRANWRINAGYAFTDAEFLDYQQSATVNLRGNTPTFAPRHTFNLWTGYEWPNGLGVNVGARYAGATFADNENVFEVDGYGLLNLGVRYSRGAVEYALNINNVTSTDYFVPHQDYAQVYPGDPVNVLGTIRIRLR